MPLYLLVLFIISCYESSYAQPRAVFSEGASPAAFSHIHVGLIKSVSGEIPSEETFDISIIAKYADDWFTRSSIDVAFSNAGSSTVSSSQKRLTEAGQSLNLILHTHRTDVYIKDGQGVEKLEEQPKRQLSAGVMLKRFNGRDFYGVNLAASELGWSAAAGTYFQLAHLRTFDKKPNEAHSNLYAEFSIQSSHIDFFKGITLKGGMLIPVNYGSLFSKQFIKASGESTHRIAIEIPIVKEGI